MKWFIFISLLLLFLIQEIWTETTVSLKANHDKRFEGLYELLGKSFDQSACEDEALSMATSESVNFEGDYGSVSSFQKSASSECTDDADMLLSNDSDIFVFPLETKTLNGEGQHLNVTEMPTSTRKTTTATTTTESIANTTSERGNLKLNKADLGQENFRLYLLKSNEVNTKTNNNNNQNGTGNKLKAGQKKQKVIKPGVPSRPIIITKGLATEPSLLLVNKTTTMGPIMNTTTIMATTTATTTARTTSTAKTTTKPSTEKVKVKQKFVKGGKNVSPTREPQSLPPPKRPTHQTTKASPPKTTTPIIPTIPINRTAINNTKFDSDSSAANVYHRTIKPESSSSSASAEFNYEQTNKSKRKATSSVAKNCSHKKKQSVRNYLEPITYETDIKDPYYPPFHGAAILIGDSSIIPKWKTKENPTTQEPPSIYVNNIISSDPLACKNTGDNKKSLDSKRCSGTNSEIVKCPYPNNNDVAAGKDYQGGFMKSLDTRRVYNSKETFDYDDLTKYPHDKKTSDVKKKLKLWLDSEVNKSLVFGKKTVNGLRKVFDIWHNPELKNLFTLKKKPDYKTNPDNIKNDLDYNLHGKNNDDDYDDEFWKQLDFKQLEDNKINSDLRRDPDFLKDENNILFGNIENVIDIDNAPDNSEDYSNNSEYSNEDCGDTTEFT